MGFGGVGALILVELIPLVGLCVFAMIAVLALGSAVLSGYGFIHRDSSASPSPAIFAAS